MIGAIHTWPVSVPRDQALFFAIVERLLLPVVIEYYLGQELVIFRPNFNVYLFCTQF